MHNVKIHAPQELNFDNPILHLWYPDMDLSPKEFHPESRDDFGPVFNLSLRRNYFCFKFADRAGERRIWEKHERCYGQHLGPEVWTVLRNNEVYPVRPEKPAGNTIDFYTQVKSFINPRLYIPDTDLSGSNTTMLGANYLEDGSTIFGLFHPRAAQVYVVGDFNDWQSPYHVNPDPEKFLKMKLYQGYHNKPNIWLLRTSLPEPEKKGKNSYKFLVVGGVPLTEDRRPIRYVQDPYARRYGGDYNHNNCKIIDPTTYIWKDTHWQTTPMDELIIYELNVYGFTDQDPRVPEEIAGSFRGIIHRIKEGYFNELGVTALALMPTSEAPSRLGPTRLGYDPCGFMTIERDFGSCDDFRALVDTAHQHGLSVIVDQVFNHTSNTFNPLWEMIDDGTPGGFYFSGSTPWGNRVATEKEIVQNMLIDACKMFIREYHIDGFRFDATHSSWLDHSLLHNLAHEIKDKGFKSDCILIAENLPNEPDLNLEGYNGYAQWCDPFHDKLKALLREGVYEEWTDDSPDNIGSVFYFCRDYYAAHTNNVINYVESHDENSVPFEVATRGDGLVGDLAKERKSRLGLFATMVAVGQPLIYMGQEFGVDRPRNRIDLNWPEFLKESYYQKWTAGLISLRRRYKGLRVSGYNPVEEGKFHWLLGPWMEEKRGGGKRIIGWYTRPNESPWEQILVMLNFDPFEQKVEFEFPQPGYWVKLADIDRVEDIPPFGENSISSFTTIKAEGKPQEFILPSSSAFIYKWESPPAGLV